MFIEILITGCSVTRTGLNNSDRSSVQVLTEKMIENIEKMNICERGFFIQKAEIGITTKERSDRLIGTIKYEKPGRYLVSLKSRAGIEAARIFISEDTILINDRLNRKLYFGSSTYFINRYGLKGSILPIIFGDFIGERFTDNDAIKNINGLIRVSCVSKGIKINYNIDVKKGKTIQAIPESSLGDENIMISYKGFYERNEMIIPGTIIIKDLKRRVSIEIRIKKIQIPWNENIEFIPGNRYEQIELL